MLSKRIIACLDVRDGAVVKGINFEGLKRAGDPATLAARYNREGIDEVVILDITASSDNRETLIHVVEAAAAQIYIPLTVGGGVRTNADVRALLNAGADKVSINTAAVDRPEFVSEAAERYGSQCIVGAIDARRPKKRRKQDDMPAGWHVYTHGGRKSTGMDAVEWAQRLVELGAGEILLTSMDRDGTKEGFDVDLTRAVADAVPVPVIASGGVGALEDLYDGLVAGHADAVLAASIFHFGQHTVGEAKDFLAERGVQVRR